MPQISSETGNLIKTIHTMKRFLFSLSILLAACINSFAHANNEGDSPNDNSQIYNLAMVEILPEFPGGSTEMYKWIAEHIIYPAQAIDEGIQGKVIVDFVISENGDIENVRVLRAKHPALDKEAVRVIKSMPKWRPGQINGKNVKTSYLVPVTFKLPQK